MNFGASHQLASANDSHSKKYLGIIIFTVLKTFKSDLILRSFIFNYTKFSNGNKRVPPSSSYTGTKYSPKFQLSEWLIVHRYFNPSNLHPAIKSLRR